MLPYRGVFVLCPSGSPFASFSKSRSINKGMESRRGNFLQDKAEEGGILAVFRPTTTQDCRKLTAGFAVFILWIDSKGRIPGECGIKMNGK